jgi:glutathione S-transferase
MAMVEIYGVPRSNFTRAVRMVCEEKSIPYVLEERPPHSPDVEALHPLGRIPAMRHGDVKLCESKAIATYLDGSFPGPRLLPSAPLASAMCEQWVSLVNTRFDAIMIRDYVFCYIFPKGEGGVPDRNAIDASLPKLRDLIRILDERLGETPYIAGDDFTYADILLMATVDVVARFPDGAAMIKEAAHLAPYYARNAARPSFRNTWPWPMPQAAC